MSLFDRGYTVLNWHIIMTVTIDSVQKNSVLKAGLRMYKSLLLGTQKSVRCPYKRVSVISGLILEKIYELFVGTNETVRNIGVSVLSGCPKSGVPLYHVGTIY